MFAFLWSSPKNLALQLSLNSFQVLGDLET